jgi:dGTP triphosphohydrolase
VSSLEGEVQAEAAETAAPVAAAIAESVAVQEATETVAEAIAPVVAEVAELAEEVRESVADIQDEEERQWLRNELLEMEERIVTRTTALLASSSISESPATETAEAIAEAAEEVAEAAAEEAEEVAAVEEALLDPTEPEPLVAAAPGRRRPRGVRRRRQ